MKLVIGVALVAVAIAATPSVNFSASVSTGVKPFTHVIEKCFGSGHALLGLREDWRVRCWMVWTLHAYALPLSCRAEARRGLARPPSASLSLTNSCVGV